MSKTKVFISISVFSILLVFTSFIKNQTRILEKRIEKINSKIILLKKDFHETQLDYSYLTTPKNLAKKINDLANDHYGPMDFSRIYFNYKDFINFEKKITTLNTANNEEKTKK